MKVDWTQPNNPVDLIQVCLLIATLVPIALPRQSVVSKPQRIVNFITAVMNGLRQSVQDTR